MNYLITYNNLLGYDPNLIHETITKKLGVNDWWHYLPNTYIVTTTLTESNLANKIIANHPGLLFLLISIDAKKYNGVLDKRAWEWLNKKGNTSIKLRSVPQPPSDPLRSALGLPPIMPKKPLTIDEILRSGR